MPDTEPQSLCRAGAQVPPHLGRALQLDLSLVMSLYEVPDPAQSASLNCCQVTEPPLRMCPSSSRMPAIVVVYSVGGEHDTCVRLYLYTSLYLFATRACPIFDETLGRAWVQYRRCSAGCPYRASSHALIPRERHPSHRSGPPAV